MKKVEIQDSIPKTQMKGCRVFSPNQVLFGSLLGSIVAAVYFLTQNYEVLRKEKEAEKVSTYAWIVLLVLTIVMLLVPTKSFIWIFTVPVAASAMQFVKSGQFTKKDIIASEEFTFHSNWHVFFIGLTSLAIILVTYFVVFYAIKFLK